MEHTDKHPLVSNSDNIYLAANRLRNAAVPTPLQENLNLSDRYEANIFLKREDLQVVRSCKIRGAYNNMASLSAKALDKGVYSALIISPGLSTLRRRTTKPARR